MNILCRNFLLKQVIEGKIKGELEVRRRRGRRRKKLLDDLKDWRGYSHLKEEALDRTMWRNRFRGDFGPVVRQNTEWMNLILHFYISPCLIPTCQVRQKNREWMNKWREERALWFRNFSEIICSSTARPRTYSLLSFC